MAERIAMVQADNEPLRARALPAEASLTFELFTVLYRELIARMRIREDTGHPLPMDERIADARKLIGLSGSADAKYRQAETLAKSYSEFNWAVFRLQRINSVVHMMGVSPSSLHQFSRHGVQARRNKRRGSVTAGSLEWH